MQTFLTAYKSTINKNCTVAGVPRNSVYYWKNRLFATTVMLVIPLSLVALIPGIYMGYSLWLVGLLLSDFVTVSAILTVAFVPGITVFARKLIFNGALYQTAVVLLYYLGSNGPGLLYLLAITVFVVISLDQKYGIISLIINTLICIYFSFAIYFGFASQTLLNEYQIDSWIGVSSNLVFLSGVAVFLIPNLFKGLQSAFTEQERLSQRLEQSVDDLHAKNKELEQFAYTISHDLKEPLRMVQNFMKLLKNKYGKQLDEKAHEYIYYARDGAVRMQNNIDDLLEYSRIGRKYTAVKETDLNELVDGILQNLKSDIDNKQANITVVSLPTIPVVPVAIKMLFQNLISNALKYHPEDNQPQIDIDVSEQNNEWIFAISDNGIGINEQYHDQIFSIFKRLHTRDEFSGSGMGLAICKKIVAQHGGSIWVESKPGRGSTFYFSIAKQYLLKNQEGQHSPSS